MSPQSSPAWSARPVHARIAALVAGLLFLASLLPLAAATPLAAPRALGSHTAAPSTVTVAGSLQDELGCPGDWQPECAATQLADDATDDVWQGSFTVPAGNYDYKAALNGTWDENYGANAQPGGGNIALAGDGSSVKFYYDHKTHWITSSKTSVIAVAPGDFQSELGCTGDWQPDCLRSWLQDPDGDGTYTFVTTDLPTGGYQGKVALNESWDVNYGAGGAPGGANIAFTVPAPGSTTTFSYDSASHVLTINSVAPGGHAHDNNVEWDGLRHDSRDTLYRAPGGAVESPTRVTLRFRTFHDDVTGVGLRVFSVRTGGASTVPMAIAAADVSCEQASLADDSCDIWQAQVPAALAAQPDNLWYRFVVTDGSDTDYYADNTAALDGGPGSATDDVSDQSWALTQYVPGFTAPAWAKDAVIYQIFPDRFRNGRSNNDPRTGDIRYDDPVLKLGWNVLPEGYCRGYATPDATCPVRFGTGTTAREQPRGRDYMGGDLKGVDQKLDYLASLGVTAIYFNPIFDAGSNHSYDTQDYKKVDPYFGTQKDFDNLIKHAKQQGIRVILDGVFNHMSSDSPLFDRYHHYSTVGACELASSPYRDWFVFTDTAPGGGNCVSSTGVANSARYDAWFGFDSIPVLRKSVAAVQAYFITAKDSIAKRWIAAGAGGWRLDVSGDASFPNGYWESFRTTVKAANPNTLTISETWQKDSTLLRMIRGDRLDTTMNYRLRDAVLGFLAPGPFDPKGFADSGTAIEPSAFLSRLASVREDYADAAYYSLMNLLDSHDTERLRWTLTPGAETPAAREQDAANVAAGKQRVRLASLIQFTVPGAPTVYYGDEVGMTGDDDPDDRRTYPWADLGGSPDTALFAHYKSLAALRRSVPALTAGDFRPLLADDTADVAAYGRKKGTSAAVVVLNRSGTAQTVHVPLAGYLRDGVSFARRFPVGGPRATSALGELVVSVPALSGVVLVANPGQDLTGPAAPAALTAAPGNGHVELAWTSSPGATSYAVYRSVVSGGGYLRVGTAPGTTYTDTDVTNGARSYYVVRALDAAGNEGPASNEAAATPSFPIGYAVLQWPKTIEITRGETTQTIYGQAYVAGLTDNGGPSSAVRAQVGFGAQGSDPAAWTTWKAMSFNAAAGNNYEYQATLKPASAGVFDLLVRFSTDNGETWTFGDQDGAFPGEPGTDLPGVLTVNAPDDSTPPAAPTGLEVTDWAASFIGLAWTAPADPDVSEYSIYRSEDGGAFALLATIDATETSYSDDSVTSGTTYGYRVTAVDAALNESDPSNEVSQVAEPKLVDVTFRVRVPDETPDGATIYLPGSIDLFGPWNPGLQQLTDQGGGIWEATVQILDGTALEYKYTRGSWDTVEWWGSITSTANRHVTISYGTDGTQLVDNTSTAWGTGSDEDKAVQAWRDPLVVSATGTAAGVVATFARNIQPQLADFASSVIVTKSGSTVAGSVAETTDGVLAWTPGATLGAGTYDVTVFSVKSDLGGDSVSMQAPYTFSFTLP